MLRCTVRVSSLLGDSRTFVAGLTAAASRDSTVPEALDCPAIPRRYTLTIARVATTDQQDHYVTAITHVREHRDIRLSKNPVIIFACRCGQLFYCKDLQEPMKVWKRHRSSDA